MRDAMDVRRALPFESVAQSVHRAVEQGDDS